MDVQLAREYEEYKAQGRIWGGVPQESIKKIKYPRIDRKIIQEFLALEDGRPVPQRPIDRTRNRISKSEVEPLDLDPESAVDRGFIEEYRLTKGA